MLALFLAAALAQPDLRIALNCPGEGSRPPSEDTGAERFQAALVVTIDGEGGRVQVPSSFIPRMHEGGANGWWPLYDLAVTDDEIAGRFRLNFLNKPFIRINRVTGDIDIRGYQRLSFHGHCAKVDRDQRAF